MCVVKTGLHRLTCIAGLLTILLHERFMTPCAEALILPVGAMLSLIFARGGIHYNNVKIYVMNTLRILLRNIIVFRG